MRREPRRFALRSDLRLEVFAVVFALGTVLHELEFLLEQARVGPFTEYMERWSRVSPSTGWSSEFGLALHLANVAISILLVALPWRRELLCLLTPTFFLSQLASPGRIASHGGLMAGGLLVVSTLGMAEWLERLGQRGRAAAARTDWCGWTLTGLTWVCTLTYLFALFYKLNPVWFSPKSAAPGFLLHPLAPILTRIGVLGAVESVVATVSIYGTLVVETLLPFLLMMRRTWVLGCLIGLVFHLPMVARGVADFPALIVAFYPAFATRAQVGELLRRCRPTWARLVGTAAFGGCGALVVVLGMPKMSWLDASAGALDRLALVTNAVLTVATVVLMIYVALTLGAWLLERLRGHAPRTADMAAGRTPPETPLASVHFGRATAGSALAAAMVLLVGAGFVYTNLAPFFGLPSAGAMFMYSGINADRSNHFFMPRIHVGDSYTYATIVGFDAHGIQTTTIREFRAFAESLATQERPVEVQLNLLRYQMSRVCRSGPGGPVRLRLRTTDGRALEFGDVCAEPSMLRYWTIPIGSRCNPGCSMLGEWVRGKLRPAE